MLPYACQIVKGCLEFFSKIFIKKEIKSNCLSTMLPVLGEYEKTDWILYILQKQEKQPVF